jgi:8-oxo-dGTP pyrophosphatase MutT (NUDIX family)
MLYLLAGPDTSLSRRAFQPGHFTASAFVLAPDGDQLLLVLHSKLQRWLQPGGHIDHDDGDLPAAACREVAEEVGLTDLTLLHDGIFDVDIHTIKAMRGEPGHQHFDVRFLFRAGSRDVVPASDADDARWFDLDRITEAFSDESVMRAVRKLRDDQHV